MARTLKPTPYHEAAAARAKAEAAAAKAEADAAAAKAKADAAAAKAKADAEPPAAKTGRQDRSPSLRRSKRTGTAKETTGGKAPRQQRAEEKQVDSIAQRRVDASKYMDRLKQWNLSAYGEIVAVLKRFKNEDLTTRWVMNEVSGLQVNAVAPDRYNF